MHHRFLFTVILFASSISLSAQEPPYDVFPEAEPPYYRVRYEASEKAGDLSFPVTYTVWVASSFTSTDVAKAPANPG